MSRGCWGVTFGVHRVLSAADELPPVTLDELGLVESQLGGRPLAEAHRSGSIAIGGDKAAVDRLLRLFPIPQPAAAS